MRSFFLISILFVLGTDTTGINIQENALYNFLFNAAKAFPSWIVQNELDPTPEIPNELSLEHSQGFVNISTGKVWNQVMSGHSGRISDPQIYLNLFLGDFTIRIYYVSDLNVTSEYKVYGSILSLVPITGAGKVTTSPLDDYQKYVELNVKAFGLTPDGYIDISAGSVDSRLYFEPSPVSFEGLSAGGYETEVEGILKDVYKSKFREDLFPLAEYFYLHIKELFDKTPLSEIIDTTMPPTTEGPPSTTTGLTSTSTDGTRTTSTTEAPCRSSLFGADGSTLLEEKVLQKIVTVKDNGKKVEITEKLVKFERELKD